MKVPNFSPNPNARHRCIFFAPDAHVLYYHKDLLYEGTCSIAGVRKFSPTYIPQTDLRDTKLDQLCVGFSRYVRKFETNRVIKLSRRKTAESYDSKQRAMILTTPINGNSLQHFLNQQNALALHAERAGGVIYDHKCAKVVVRVINSFCTCNIRALFTVTVWVGCYS